MTPPALPGGSGGASRAFLDRAEAGRALAAALSDRVGPETLVLAIPRGGVAVAAEIADAFGCRLDIVVPRKLGAPGNPELGIGAVADGVRFVDEHLARRVGASQAYLEAEVAEQQAEVRRRTAAYRDGRPPLELAGRDVLVVDDGIATGATAIAALRWCRHAGAGRVVLAVPVASGEVVRTLGDEADEVIALQTPVMFQAVGQWYQDFGQIQDDQVIEALRRNEATRGTA